MEVGWQYQVVILFPNGFYRMQRETSAMREPLNWKNLSRKILVETTFSDILMINFSQLMDKDLGQRVRGIAIRKPFGIMGE